MLRSESVAIVDILRKTVRPTVDQMPRGYIQIDAAGLHSLGYDFADGAHVATIMGLKVTRLETLADGHRDYYDEGDNLIYTT